MGAPTEASTFHGGLHWAAETMSRDELQALQLARLRKTLANARRHVAWHRARLAAVELHPDALRDLSDLQRLPFTLKSDLREHYPFGLFARPICGLARLHASSGTTGRPTVVGYTAGDLQRWADLVARSFYCAGVRPGDLVHNAYGYGLFTGGLGAHDGATRLGCPVVPLSGGGSERQIALIMDFHPRVLCATPSYALVLAEVAAQQGVDLRNSGLAIGMFGAEPWSAAMREEIETRIGLRAVDIYGLSEIMGPGVACECACRSGLHGWEDHFLFEVIDPDTGAVLGDGEVGELVITTLTKEALPMLRYRTRDITRLCRKRCDCGRTHTRILRLTGRSDDMLIIRGVNVYPSQIEAVLVGRAGLSPNYQIEVSRDGVLDRLRIQVEAEAGVAPDSWSARAADAVHHIKSMIGVSAELEVCAPGSLPRSQGKAVRVRDLRAKAAVP